MHYVLFGVVFLCFAFHTVIHVLGYLKKIRETKAVYAAIGISMFLGWFLYFLVSFLEFPAGLSITGWFGLVLVIIGFCLFFAAHKKVHQRMHTGKGELITSGLYKHIRHPMYIGEILLLIGAPILGQSLITLYLSPLLIIQIIIWAYLEEKGMMKEFPLYAEYKKKTWF